MLVCGAIRDWRWHGFCPGDGHWHWAIGVQSLNVNAGRAGPLVAWQPDGGLGDADMDQCAGRRSMDLALMTSICVGSKGHGKKLGAGDQN